mmetsp:Transcript_6694/g.12309  ORF Transcript_6694/g.12309 Transcript_6694/m.12309 type:complete len:315 (+) Transcript_6694:1143-2087(+)
MVDELNLIRHEDPSLAFEPLPHTVFEDALSDVRIESRQRVVEQVHVALGIDGPGDTHSLFLASGEVDAPLADLCLVPGDHVPQVLPQSRDPNGLVVELLVEVESEQDVLANRRVEDPRLLRDVGDRAPRLDDPVEAGDLAEDRVENRAFSRACWADDCYQLSVLGLQVDVLESHEIIHVASCAFLGQPVLQPHCSSLSRLLHRPPPLRHPLVQVAPAEGAVRDLHCRVVVRERVDLPLVDLVPGQIVFDTVHRRQRYGQLRDDLRKEYQRHAQDRVEGQRCERLRRSQLVAGQDVHGETHGGHQHRHAEDETHV